MDSKKILALVLTITVISACCFAADVNNLSDYFGFDEIEIIKADWAIQSLIIEDFNGDGLNDIAFANNNKAKIELLLQKDPSQQDEQQNYEDSEDINQLAPNDLFNRKSIPISQKIFSMVTGDFNNDGLIDIAFYGKPNGLYLILQKNEDSDKIEPKWMARKKIDIDDGLISSNALVKSDFNNDGKDDIALAAQDGIYLLLQKDDQSLSEQVKYPTSALVMGVDASDLNGDGLNDLVLITNDQDKLLHVRFAMANGQLGPELRFFIEAPYVLQMDNIDQNPKNEILTIDRRSGRLITYSLKTENKNNEDWPILFYPFSSAKDNRKRDIAIADIDGDGLDDVIATSPATAELILYKQKTDIGLTDAVRFPCFSDIDNIAARDLDKDGKAEIVVLSIKEKLIGKVSYENSRLTFPKPFNIIDEPVAMEIADLDNDKKADCIYINKDANDLRTLAVIYNLKNDKKQTDSVIELKLEKLQANPEGIKIVDANQDKLKDIIIFVKYEKPILVLQTEKGLFQIADPAKTQASLIQQAALSSTAVANIDDNKGREILIAQDNFARSLKLSENNKWQIIDQYNAKNKNNKINAVNAFKFKNSDSKPDILLLDGQKGQLQILNAGEDQTYRIVKELDVDRWDNSLHLKILYASLTGKDVKNIIIFDQQKFALIKIPENETQSLNCQQLFSYETKIKEGIYGNMITGDINNDGTIDLVMVDYKGNHIEILTLKDNKPVPVMSFKIFEEKSYQQKQNGKVGVEPREMRIADVTGDGKNDLVTIIHDRVIIYPQD